MVALGRLIEKGIDRAKQAQVQVGSRGGVQPILSVESQLTAQRVRELIDASAQKVVSASMPELKGAAALEVGEGPAAYGAKLIGHQAKLAVCAEIGSGSAGRQGDPTRGFIVRGQLARLPFPNSQFRYLIARLATHAQGDMQRAVRELSRVLAPGGQGVIVDYHPFGLYAKRGASRVRPAESGVHRIEDYFRIVAKAGMRVIDLKEAYVDEAMRQMFREEEIQAYRNLKNTPLLIFLFVYKPKGSQ